MLRARAVTREADSYLFCCLQTASSPSAHTTLSFYCWPLCLPSLSKAPIPIFRLPFTTCNSVSLSTTHVFLEIHQNPSAWLGVLEECASPPPPKRHGVQRATRGSSTSTRSKAHDCLNPSNWTRTQHLLGELKLRGPRPRDKKIGLNQGLGEVHHQSSRTRRQVVSMSNNVFHKTCVPPSGASIRHFPTPTVSVLTIFHH